MPRIVKQPLLCLNAVCDLYLKLSNGASELLGLERMLLGRVPLCRQRLRQLKNFGGRKGGPEKEQTIRCAEFLGDA